MFAIRNFDDLLTLYTKRGERKRAAIVCPSDSHTEYVVRRCISDNLVQLLLLLDGNESEELKDFCRGHSEDSVRMINYGSTEEAARAGVQAVKRGEVDVLMKGTLNTDTLLHAVIDKQGGEGLIAPGSVMTHLTLVEAPAYHKLLMFSDAAVIPHPGLDQFDAMLRYDTETARRLGIECPKAALIHFTEKTNGRFPLTIEYAELIKRAGEGRYGHALVAGPMDVKTACDAESAQIKRIGSDVVGDADILIMPDLEAGNVFYKTVSYFGKARMAGLITGAEAPIVVASRADSAESKFYSLILACIAS